MEAAFADISSLFESDKLFQAARAFDKVIEEFGAEAETYIENDEKLSWIRASSVDASRMLSLVEDLEGWNLSVDGEKVKVWYKKEDGTPFHSLRAEGILEADMLSMLSIVYETDLHPQIFGFVAEQNLLKTPTRTRKICQTVFRTPWPLSKREVSMHGWGIDGFDDDGCFFIYFREVNDATDGVKKPEIRRGHVRMNCGHACLLFQPIAPGKTRVVNMANMDPKLPFVSPTLVNWAARSIFRHTLRSLEVKARGIEDLPHAERVKTDPVYIWLRDRVNSYAKDNWKEGISV